MNKKNDYYTVNSSMLRKHTTILNDNQSESNDKPVKAHNGFNKVFNKFIMAVGFWVLGACAIFCPTVIIAHYKTHIIWPIVLGLVLYLMSLFFLMSLSLFLLVVYVSDKR